MIKYLHFFSPIGSHDSFTSTLDPKSELAPDTSQAIKDLVKIFGATGREVIYRWSVTQSLGFTEQLHAGIRYFDLRVSSKKETEDLYFVHGIYGGKIEDSMREINSFLDQHQREIVLLDFNHFYRVTEGQHTQFLSLLLDIFGSKVCPFVDVESTTLDMMWENNLQVIIFYHDDIIKEHLQFWPGDLIPSPWADKTEVSKLMKFLEKNYKEGRPTDKFYITQGICTPDSYYVIAHFATDLKNAMAKKVAPPYVSWLKTRQAGYQGVNICILDFVEMSDYIPSVLELNRQLLDSLDRQPWFFFHYFHVMLRREFTSMVSAKQALSIGVGGSIKFVPLTDQLRSKLYRLQGVL